MSKVKNVTVYHVISDVKHQYEVGQEINPPFDVERDYSHWPEYKQKAEILLEQWRVKYYSHLPSRNTALFVASTLEEAENWARYKFNKGGIYFLYEILLVEGDLVYLDTDCFEGVAEIFMENELLLTHNLSLDECLKRYWSGEFLRQKGGHLVEGMFNGKAIIISKKKMLFNKQKNTITEII